MEDNHGHVVISAVCRKRDSKSPNLSNSWTRNTRERAKDSTRRHLLAISFSHKKDMFARFRGFFTCRENLCSITYPQRANSESGHGLLILLHTKREVLAYVTGVIGKGEGQGRREKMRAIWERRGGSFSSLPNPPLIFLTSLAPMAPSPSPISQAREVVKEYSILGQKC